MEEEFLDIKCGVTNYTPKYIKGIMESLRMYPDQLNRATLLEMVGEYLTNNKEVYDEYEAKRNIDPELGAYADEYKLVFEFLEGERKRRVKSW